MFKDLDQMPLAIWVAFAAMIVTIGICLMVLASSVVKIDQGLATLVGTVSGFGLVAWQARIAFGNYMRSQAKQAELDREAREHNAALELKATQREETRRIGVLRSAIRAEIVSIMHEVYQQAEAFEAFALMHEKMGEGGHQNTSKGIIFRTFDAPVFKANIKDIGLLGVSIGSDVIKVLSRANGAEFKPLDSLFAHDFLVTFYRGLAKQFKEWCDDLYHVAMRIRAVEEGTSDPGTLLDTESERRAKLGAKK